MKIHLVDGTYELFRAYFGAPPARAPDGREVGAARGLLRSLIALLNEDDCSHVAVAFDRVIESFRNELFAGYKTGEGLEPDLLEQFPLAEELARALGVVVWPMVEFEADDAIATAAHRFAGARGVEQVKICSPDKDLAQCVAGDEVVLVDRMRRNVYDEVGIVEKWGVGPGSIPDLLALMGDPADGIPGIPRWGRKSCAAVLSVYGTIENIPDDPEQWRVKVRGAKGLAANLAEQRADALLYKNLATLRRDVPLAEQAGDLEWRGAVRGALEPLAEAIGATRTLDRIARWQQ